MEREREAMCGRGVRHSRFAVWPARRAKRTGIATDATAQSLVSLPIGVERGDFGGVAYEGSSTEVTRSSMRD
jgi:hypothetical protein